MKPLGRLTRRVTFRSGIIVFAAMVVLTLSSTSAPPRGTCRSRGSVAGLPTRTAPATADHNGTAIRPFRISVPDEALAELRRRVLATRWPDKETVADRSQGNQVTKL